LEDRGVDIIDRALSGIFVRLKRGPKWENVDITDCDEAAITNMMMGRDQEELIRWLTTLAKLFDNMIHTPELDIVEIPPCDWKNEDILKAIIELCKIYKKTGDVYDIRKGSAQ
jgi:hypothetical protein